MFTTLIESQRLFDNLGNPDWVIFDCRFDLAQPAAGQGAYDQGHIPGAQYAHLEIDLSGPKSGSNGRHPLPDADRFMAFLGSMGVGNDTQVIAYDASAGLYAARLWWLLRWLGHRQVAVLDGGLAAWTANGLPQTPDRSAPVARHFAGAPGHMPTIDATHLAQALARAHALVIDARAAERFRGETEPLDAVAGHIPSALNRFYQINLASDGRFKPGPVLREEFLALIGDCESTRVVQQCGSGVTACHNLLAMEIAGLYGSALYPGSWSEWCSDPARPVATGA